MAASPNWGGFGNLMASQRGSFVDLYQHSVPDLVWKVLQKADFPVRREGLFFASSGWSPQIQSHFAAEKWYRGETACSGCEATNQLVIRPASKT